MFEFGISSSYLLNFQTIISEMLYTMDILISNICIRDIFRISSFHSARVIGLLGGRQPLVCRWQEKNSWGLTTQHFSDSTSEGSPKTYGYGGTVSTRCCTTSCQNSISHGYHWYNFWWLGYWYIAEINFGYVPDSEGSCCESECPHMLKG